MPSSAPVVIVGAGLSGLACAKHLSAKKVEVLVLEREERVGGRVRTDQVDGFLLDRGFQVLLDSYEEARAVFDWDALRLFPFRPGALVRKDGAFHLVGDPTRDLRSVFAGLRAPVGSFADKLRTAFLGRRLAGELGRLELRNRSALEVLWAARLSDRMLESFFRPFLAGVFLDRELDVPGAWLAWLWQRFATGRATLPAEGMEALPRQLAAALPAGSVRTGARVERIEERTLVLAGGERLAAAAIVVATEAGAGLHASELEAERTLAWRGVTRLDFDAPAAPVERPLLVLNGEGPSNGPINDLCVPSVIAPSYAPPGRHLVGATVLGADHEEVQLLADVRAQLERWFPGQPATWRHLRTLRIPRALPRSWRGLGRDAVKGPQVGPALFRCGDFCDTPSIQGALRSGRTAAAAVLGSQMWAIRGVRKKKW